MRTVPRPRRYVRRHWLVLLMPLFAYNHNRDAYVFRLVGRRVGPVLKRDRREHREPPIDGVEQRRRAKVTPRIAA